MPSGQATPASEGGTQAGPSSDPQTKSKDLVVVTDKVKAVRIRDSDKRIINQYEFEECLGKGQHGQVWVAKDVRTEHFVAIKMLKRKDKKAEKMNALRKRNLPSSPHVPLVDKLSDTELKIMKEIAIMKKLQHPHVVRLLEVMDDHLLKEIYLVMEYCSGGEIKWRTSNQKPTLRVSQTRRIIRDVILGLEYLHYQGIIHRDIKPANLLWSEDRRMVKIGDFGVSHFSMAQRIAAAGQRAANTNEDPILMDEGDLSKFAGTPMFLAPEIVADASSDVSRNSTPTLTASSRKNRNGAGLGTPKKRPPITKAIDVWALGVTIYCLLFGDLPFKGETEFAIYRSIREDDWTVPDTMGVDEIPTGGRSQPKPRKGYETEGYLLVNLLEGLLQKDPKKRLTLEETKRHPWILRDLQHPDIWLRTTQIDGSLAATDAEAGSALSFVRFRWTVDFARTLMGALRGVRSQRSFRHTVRPEPRRDKGKARARDDVGTRSLPVVTLSRQKSIAIGVHEREKEKEKEKLAEQQRASLDVGSPTRRATHHAKHPETLSSGNGLRVEGSGPKPRRGSAPSHGSSRLDMLNVPATAPHSPQIACPRPTHVLLRQPSKSPRVTTPTTPSPSSPDLESNRNRFSLTPGSIYRWFSGRSGTPSPQEASTSTSALQSGAESPATAPSIMFAEQPAPHIRDLTLRRSEDAFQHISSRKSSSSSGPLTLAMRAASWGEVGTYRPAEDMQSMYSGEREETLDDDTRFIGVGGYAQSPVPSLPSGMLSTVSSAASLNTPAFNAAQALLHHRSETPPTPTDRHHRSHATSPLARSPRRGFSRSRSRLSQSSYEYEEESSVSGEHTPSEADFAEQQPSTSQIYHEEDESEDEESTPLEVRTARRPSVSVTRTSPSPSPGPRFSRDRTRPTICI